MKDQKGEGPPGGGDVNVNIETLKAGLLEAAADIQAIADDYNEWLSANAHDATANLARDLAAVAQAAAEKLRKAAEELEG